MDSCLLFTTCIVLILKALSRGMFLKHFGSQSALLTNSPCVFSNVLIAPGLMLIVAHPYTIGNEPADLTVQPPPPELPRVGSFFSYRCLVFPKKCPQRKA